jgi:ABA sandwich protein
MEMTVKDVMEMTAGPDMNVTVGYHIMDLHGPPWIYPDYSGELVEARRVVEKMKSQGWIFRLAIFPSGLHSAWFEKHKGIHRPEDEHGDQIFNGEGDTESLAVCRAALMTIAKGLRL